MELNEFKTIDVDVFIEDLIHENEQKKEKKN